jgi:hypothetical protein
MEQYGLTFLIPLLQVQRLLWMLIINTDKEPSLDQGAARASSWLVLFVVYYWSKIYIYLCRFLGVCLDLFLQLQVRMTV